MVWPPLGAILLVEPVDGWPPLGALCAPILPIVEPADGGEELCSVAPPEVSALPDGGTVADLEVSDVAPG